MIQQESLPGGPSFVCPSHPKEPLARLPEQPELQKSASVESGSTHRYESYWRVDQRDASKSPPKDQNEKHDEKDGLPVNPPKCLMKKFHQKLHQQLRPQALIKMAAVRCLRFKRPSRTLLMVVGMAGTVGMVKKLMQNQFHWALFPSSIPQKHYQV